MHEVRLCVVGTGRWSTRVHLPALKRLTAEGMVRVTGVCDSDRRKAAEYAGALGTEAVYGDAGDMLDKAGADGMVIVLPHRIQPGMIRLAISRKIPFLTEKPPAMDGRTHNALLRGAGDLVHLVGYNRRFSPYVRQARQWLKGARIQSVTAMFSRFRRLGPDLSGLAGHPVDTVLFLGDSPVKKVRIDGAPVNRTQNLFLGGWFESGARFDVLFTPYTASAEEHYIVRCADRIVKVAFPFVNVVDLPGSAQLHQDNRVSARMGPGDFDLADDDLSALSGVEDEHRSFARALRDGGGAELESTLKTSLATQKIREKIDRYLRRPAK